MLLRALAVAVAQPSPEVAHLYQAVRDLDLPRGAAELGRLPIPILAVAAALGAYALTLGARWARPLAGAGGLGLGAALGLTLGPLLQAKTNLSPTTDAVIL